MPRPTGATIATTPDLAYDRIEVSTPPNLYLDSLKEPPAEQEGTALDAELDVAYADQIVAYEGQLDRFGANPRGRYPKVTIVAGCIRTDVTVDPDLDTQLLRIYIVHGWPDVDAVSVALRTAATTRPQAWPWSAVTDFYDFTRNRLLLKIRAALIEIDRRSTERVILLLNQTRDRLHQDWQKAGLHQVTATVPLGEFDVRPPGTASYRRSIEKTLWRMNEKVAKDLYPWVEEAVLRRGAYQAQQRKIADLEGVVAKYGKLPIDLTKQDLENAREQLRTARAALNEAMEAVYAVMPTAVLAVPLLSVKKLSRAVMEDRIGAVLAPLRQQTEELARKIIAGEGWVAHEIPDWDRKKPLSRLFPAKQPGPDVITIRGPAGGGATLANPSLLYNRRTFETGVAELAVPIVAVASDDARLPMMSTTLLASIVDPDGPVPPGTFIWVVWAHYVTAVNQALIDREDLAEALAAILSGVSKIAAVVSLALLFSPLAPFAGIPAALEGIADALGFGLIALQAYTLTDQVATLNIAVKDALSAVDPQNPATMAALSELVAARWVAIDQVTTTFLSELAWIVGAHALPELKYVVHVRTYYFDLDTLLNN